MPITIHVANRYDAGDPVVGAAVTLDYEAVTAQTPRTGANGLVVVKTDHLTDGNHLLRIVPKHTSHLQVGPHVAEDLDKNVTRMFRALELVITVSKGKVQAVSPAAGQQRNGSVGAGTNPVRVLLQPIFFRGLHQIPNARQYGQITLIVIHQTAGSTNIGGTLSHFSNPYKDMPKKRGSAHYVISAEAEPQIVKVVQDSGLAGHAAPIGLSWWSGSPDVNNFSIGIELSHKAKTPWPEAQISALMGLLELLLDAYPSISRHRIVGHTDVLLIDRDCPGLEFDWVVLEKFGLGLVPRAGALPLESVYGGFFALRPQEHLRLGDRDGGRVWGGGKAWPKPAGPVAEAGPAPAARGSQPSDTVTGNPIRELQTDLRDIGYFVDLHGDFDAKTQFAVERFQKHFFSGSRRSLIKDSERGKVNALTAEYIKRVRP
jgi:AmpD protein